MAPKLIGKSRKDIEVAIDSINSGGATNIAGGLESAFKAMIERKSKNQVTGIMLLSDGVDNRQFHGAGPAVTSFFNTWKKKLANHEFSLHSFGYGDDHDAELLDQCSTEN